MRSSKRAHSVKSVQNFVHFFVVRLLVATGYGRRWNPKGLGILHTSRTPELALWETLVHLPPFTLSELPQPWLTTLRLPDGLDPVFRLTKQSLTDNTLFGMEFFGSVQLTTVLMNSLHDPKSVQNFVHF